MAKNKQFLRPKGLPVNGKSEKVIVITGGHAVTTAVATVEELQSRAQYLFHWIGARSALEGKKVEGIESIVFPQLGVKLHSIITGRLQRRFTRYTIPSLCRIPLGIIQSFVLLGRIKPDVIVSFGGFAGFPVVLAGYIRGVPVILHEQTIAVGLANKVSSWFVKKVALARENSKQYFDPSKVILTGNPIMKSIRNVRPKLKKGTPPVIFITCGSRGSQIINTVLYQLIPRLTDKYKIIHLTGKLDYDQFNSLKVNKKSHYKPLPTVNPLEIAEIYSESDIIISRAGANTVSEIMSVSRPSIVIPIPWTRFNEQQKNADSLVESGIALLLPQEELTEKALGEAISEVDTNWNKIVNTAHPLYSTLDSNAAKNLANIIEDTLIKD